MNLNILYEDKHIIVCEKPIGVLSQSNNSMADDMINILKNYLYESNPESYPQNNSVFVGLVHRLDRPVGGLMVFAKNQPSLKKLNEQLQSKKFQKYYFAVCENLQNIDFKLGEKVGLVDYLLKDQKTNLSVISNGRNKNAKKSILEYTILKEKNSLLLADIKLLTGRHHQIRVQMNNAKLSLWGDTKYNSTFLERNPEKKWVNIALFAHKIEFEHPQTKKLLSFELTPTEYPFSEFFNE